MALFHHTYSAKGQEMDDSFNELYNRAKEAFENKRWHEAETLLQKIVQVKPYYADVQHKLGLLFHQKGDFKKAIDHFTEAVKINPNYTEARLNLTITLNAVGQYNKALEIFGGAVQQAILDSGKIDPYIRGKLANEHLKLGNIYYELGEFKEAADQYRKGVNLCPDYPDIRTKLGISLREFGQFEEAIQEFKQVIRKKNSFLNARNHLGITYFKMGRDAEALAEWDQVLKMNPKDRIASACKSMLEARRMTQIDQ